MRASASEKTSRRLGTVQQGQKKREREKLFSTSHLFSFLSCSFPLISSAYHKKKKKKSIAPTAEEEEELDACDAWVAALVDAEIADEQQEAFHLENEQSSVVAAAAASLAAAVSAVSVH